MYFYILHNLNTPKMINILNINYTHPSIHLSSDTCPALGRGGSSLSRYGQTSFSWPTSSNSSVGDTNIITTDTSPVRLLRSCLTLPSVVNKTLTYLHSTRQQLIPNPDGHLTLFYIIVNNIHGNYCICISIILQF